MKPKPMEGKVSAIRNFNMSINKKDVKSFRGDVWVLSKIHQRIFYFS